MTRAFTRFLFLMFSFRLGGGNIKYNLPTGPPVDKCCEFCNNSHHMGGPIWINNLHHTVFVQSLLDSLTEERFSTFPRMTGMISMALEELEDVPLYYELARLCNITKLSQGKMTLYISAILNAGYRVSLTHANKVNFSAPLSVPHAFFFSSDPLYYSSTGSRQTHRPVSSGA